MAFLTIFPLVIIFYVVPLSLFRRMNMPIDRDHDTASLGWIGRKMMSFFFFGDKGARNLMTFLTLHAGS